MLNCRHVLSVAGSECAFRRTVSVHTSRLLNKVSLNPEGQLGHLHVVEFEEVSRSEWPHKAHDFRELWSELEPSKSQVKEAETSGGFVNLPSTFASMLASTF